MTIYWDFVHGNIAAHFYYIIFTIQLYLLFPLIIKIFIKLPKVTLVVSAISTILLNQFWNHENKRLIFASWIFYFILGMFISKNDNKSSRKAIIIEAIGFISTAIIFVLLKYKIDILNQEAKIYQTIFVLYSTFASLLFLNIFKRLEVRECKVQDKIIEFFEPNTYLIFLYHVLFISIAEYDIMSTTKNSKPEVFLGQIMFTVIALLALCFIANLLRKRLKIIWQKSAKK